MSPPPPVLVERAQERISFLLYFFFPLTKIKKPTRKQPGPASVARQGQLSPAPRRGRPSSRGGDGSFRFAAPAFATRLSVASWLFVGIKGNLPVTREPAVACCGGEELQEGRDGTGQCRAGAAAATRTSRDSSPGQAAALALALALAGAGLRGAGRTVAAMALRGGRRWARLASALRAGSSGQRHGGRVGDTPQYHDLRAALRKVPGRGGEGRGGERRGGGKRRRFPAAGHPAAPPHAARSGSGCA